MVQRPAALVTVAVPMAGATVARPRPPRTRVVVGGWLKNRWNHGMSGGGTTKGGGAASAGGGGAAGAGAALRTTTGGGGAGRTFSRAVAIGAGAASTHSGRGRAAADEFGCATLLL